MTDTLARRVEPGSHLTLHYRISLLPGGQVVIDTFDGKPATLQLGIGQMADAIEARLLGLAEGREAVFDLAEGEAYGERNPALLQRVARAALARAGDGTGGATAETLSPGDTLEVLGPDGRRLAGTVHSLDAGDATIDFNHPLAGRALRVEVRLIGVL
ncbi:MAG: peptidylprolyl isomerase [Lautropia sp.]